VEAPGRSGAPRLVEALDRPLRLDALRERQAPRRALGRGDRPHECRHEDNDEKRRHEDAPGSYGLDVHGDLRSASCFQLVVERGPEAPSFEKKASEGRAQGWNIDFMARYQSLWKRSWGSNCRFCARKSPNSG